MASTNTVLCPPLGHKTFEKELKHILLDDADTPAQISKFVRPWSCVTDDLGAVYAEGELQKKDLLSVKSLFNYQQFISRAYKANLELFKFSQCRIYQFQTMHRVSGRIFCFGLFITDSQHNLIDFCVDTNQQDKRRAVLVRLMRTICTPESLAIKLSH